MSEHTPKPKKLLAIIAALAVAAFSAQYIVKSQGEITYPFAWQSQTGAQYQRQSDGTDIVIRSNGNWPAGHRIEAGDPSYPDDVVWKMRLRF